MIGAKRAPSELVLGGKLVRREKFLEGVKWRKVGAKLRAACILN